MAYHRQLFGPYIAHKPFSFYQLSAGRDLFFFFAVYFSSLSLLPPATHTHTHTATGSVCCLLKLGGLYTLCVRVCAVCFVGHFKGEKNSV